MTVINATTQGKAAYIIADMAYVRDEDAALIAVASKFITGMAFPFLIAFTGNPNPLALGNALQDAQPRNGTELLSALPSILRDMESGFSGLDAGLVVATWAKRHGRPMIHLIANTANQWPGTVTPFEPFFVEWVVTGNLPVEEALGRRVDMADPQSFAPYRDSIALVEAQRRHHRFENCGRPAYRIGGGIEVAQLTRRGVTVRQVHEWQEDRVGKPIAPMKELA